MGKQMSKVKNLNLNARNGAPFYDFETRISIFKENTEFKTSCQKIAEEHGDLADVADIVLDD